MKNLICCRPGDIRRLLFTLSDADELAGLFEYRFSSNGELGGHTVGNILLTALTELKGNFPKAIQAASRLLAVRGRIIPVTLDYTILCAELVDGEIVRGESTIPIRENREPIKRVFFEPRENGKTHHHPTDGSYECQAHKGAIDALLNADVIIIGPGSLYTSIMPNLVIKGIVEAIQQSPAMKIYICNVMTQPGETDGYAVTDHVNAVLDHARIALDYVLVNNQPAPTEIIQEYVRQEIGSTVDANPFAFGRRAFNALWEYCASDGCAQPCETYFLAVSGNNAGCGCRKGSGFL